MPPSGPKKNPTIRHILETPCLHTTAPRLDKDLTPRVNTIDYGILAQLLGTISDQNTIFFPDMCFLNGPEVPDDVWDQILGRRLVISPYIGREMQEWLPDPYRNQRVAATIRAAAAGEANGVQFDDTVAIPDCQAAARVYYVTLLGYRKSQVRDLIGWFTREQGRDPDTDELDRLFKQHSLPKDLKLLQKGAEDLARGSHFFSDEDLVVTAGIGGLSDGSHAVILTRDQDVLEQFDKFADLLTMHYQAMLFAERFAAAPADFKTRPLPAGEPTIDAHFLAGDSLMVRKPVEKPEDFVGWLLPAKYEPVKLTCILLGGNDPNLKFSMMTFNAERDVYRLIATKGLTRGLSTDRLAGKNCHVTGYPTGVPEPRDHVLIVRDRSRPAENGDMRYAALDIGHAIKNHMLRSEPVDSPPEAVDEQPET